MPKPLNYFDIEIYGGVLVTRVHSNVGSVPLRLFGVEINALRTYLTELGATNLLFEIQPTSALSPEQIRGMVFFAREVRQRGGACAFCGGGAEVQKALSRFGLSKPTDWSPALADGLIALGGAAASPLMPAYVPVPAAPGVPAPAGVAAIPPVQASPASVRAALTPAAPASRPAPGQTNRPPAPWKPPQRGLFLPAHEITLRAHHRQPILVTSRVCSHLAQQIRAVSNQLDYSVWAFVFMHDHFHLLVQSQRLNYEIGDYVDSIKKAFQEKAVELLAEDAPQVLGRLRSQQGGRLIYDFWQRTSGQNRNVEYSLPVRPLIKHLHENPVRKGLVLTPLEWKWSSAGSYAGRPLQELQHDPVPPELLGD